MSQQEFESQRHQSEEYHRPRYPYTWSAQHENESMPRDEPPGGNHSTFAHADDRQENINQSASFQRNKAGNQRAQIRPTTRVPWWAQPQPHNRGSMRFRWIVIIAIALIVIPGGLGLVGAILGFLGQIALGLLGTLLLLFCVFVVTVFVIVAILWQILRRTFTNRHP